MATVPLFSRKFPDNLLIFHEFYDVIYCNSKGRKCCSEFKTTTIAIVYRLAKSTIWTNAFLYRFLGITRSFQRIYEIWGI